MVRDESAPRMIDNSEAVKPVTWDESATEQINDPSAKQPEVTIYEKRYRDPKIIGILAFKWLYFYC